MSCVFAKSKYYKQAKADPCQVAPPLGYDFLYSNEPTKKLNRDNIGQLVIKQIFDKPHHKVLSQKKTSFQKIEQFLKVSQAPRKTIYLPPTLLQFMRKEYSKQIYHSISKCFLPTFKQQFTMVQMAQIIRNPNVQSLLHIQDYALSRFFFLCEGSDPWKMKYLYTFFNRRYIEYPVQCQVINHNGLDCEKFLVPSTNNTIISPPMNIQDVQQVKSLITSINEANKKKDALYSGVHFYFADFTTAQINVQFFQREDLHFKYLQYYLTMLTGILGNGQTAIIKLAGTYKYKTSQYIFLLKLIFNGKVSLYKSLISNPFQPYSYVICQYYNKLNGDIIHKYLIENYNILKQYGQDQLILDPKKVLRQDLHNNLRSFNEVVINKGIQNNLKLFQSNANIEFYPARDKIIEKLPKYAVDLEELIKQVVKVPEKPAQEEMKDEKNDRNKSNNKADPNNPSNQAPVPRPAISSIGLFSKSRAPTPTPK